MNERLNEMLEKSRANASAVPEIESNTELENAENVEVKTETGNQEETNTEVKQNQDESASKKVDKRELTDVEKATFSFKKQLGKEKAKQQVLLDRIKALEDASKNIKDPGTKLDNETDVDYVKRLAKTEAQRLLHDSQLSSLNEQKAEFERNEVVQVVNENIRRNFTDEKDAEAFRSEVAAAINKGFQLDKDVDDYTFASEVGPKMIRFFVARPDIHDYLSKLPTIVKAKKLAELENAIMSEVKPTNIDSKKPAVIGNLGTGGNGSSNENMNDLEKSKLLKQKLMR